MFNRTGVFLHTERTTTQTRKDGTVQKPTLLERYFHRPLAPLFDDLDVIAYHSQFATSKTPPQYATERWLEKPWDDSSYTLQVYRRRPTPNVSLLHYIFWHLRFAPSLYPFVILNLITYKICGARVNHCLCASPSTRIPRRVSTVMISDFTNAISTTNIIFVSIANSPFHIQISLRHLPPLVMYVSM